MKKKFSSKKTHFLDFVILKNENSENINGTYREVEIKMNQSKNVVYFRKNNRF